VWAARKARVARLGTRVPQHNESSLLRVNRVLDMDCHHIRPDGPTDLLCYLPSMDGRTSMTYLHRVGFFLCAYTCRGCGTEITNKGAFKKCPVCGIKWD